MRVDGTMRRHDNLGTDYRLESDGRTISVLIINWFGGGRLCQCRQRRFACACLFMEPFGLALLGWCRRHGHSGMFFLVEEVGDRESRTAEGCAVGGSPACDASMPEDCGEDERHREAGLG